MTIVNANNVEMLVRIEMPNIKLKRVGASDSVRTPHVYLKFKTDGTELFEFSASLSSNVRLDTHENSKYYSLIVCYASILFCL